MDNSIKQNIKYILKDIDMLLNTGKCNFNNGTCCGCPGDNDPYDTCACYKYVLNSVKERLNELYK